MGPATRGQSGGGTAGAWYVGAVVALPRYILRVLAHTTRALQLLFKMIDNPDTLDECA